MVSLIQNNFQYRKSSWFPSCICKQEHSLASDQKPIFSWLRNHGNKGKMENVNSGIIIIRLMLSVWLSTKVITSSGFHCSLKDPWKVKFLKTDNFKFQSHKERLEAKRKLKKKLKEEGRESVRPYYIVFIYSLILVLITNGRLSKTK